jgi:colanic acid/amylovoran biosynthesis protein
MSKANTTQSMTKKKKIRILLTDAGSPHNKGDAAIFITMLESLQNAIPNAEFVGTSDLPKAATEEFGTPMVHALYAVPLPPLEEKIMLLLKLKSMDLSYPVKLLPRTLRFLFWALFHKINKNISTIFVTREEKNVLDECIKADAIISCGGGFITDDYWGGLYFILFVFWMYKKVLNKPVMIYAQSIGPFHWGIYKFLTKISLNQADLITVRESISKEVLTELGIKKPDIHVTADSAFLLKSADEEKIKDILSHEKISKGDNVLIGISVRRWICRKCKNPKKKHEEYKQAISKVADILIERLNAKIIFISTYFSDSKYISADSDIAYDILKMMTNKQNVKIITTEYTSQELKGIIGQMDLFIGTRAHSTIFSTTMHVPTVGISYEFKMNGFFKMLGLEKYVCNIEEITTDSLLNKIMDAWGNREEIKQKLKECAPRVQQCAAINAELASEFIGRNINH